MPARSRNRIDSRLEFCTKNGWRFGEGNFSKIGVVFQHGALFVLGLGLFLLAAPHLASWIIGKAADLLYRVLGFITA